MHFLFVSDPKHSFPCIPYPLAGYLCLEKQLLFAQDPVSPTQGTAVSAQWAGTEGTAQSTVSPCRCLCWELTPFALFWQVGGIQPGPLLAHHPTTATSSTQLLT